MANYVSGKVQLAARVGVSNQTLLKWEMDEGFPKVTSEGYDVDAVANWVVNNPDIKSNTRLKVTKATGINSELKEEDLNLDVEEGSSPALERFRLARAKLAELELAQKSGELVLLKEYAEGEAARFSLFKSKLETLTHTLPPRIQNMTYEEVRAELQRTFDELLRELQRDVSITG